MKAHLIGSGIGNLAAAAFMIRDAGVAGENITIYEASDIAGGSLDGTLMRDGYSLRGGRMLTSDHYECLWDLMRTIPSLEQPHTSVYDETMRFNELVPAHSQARLVDARRHKVDVSTMGFTMSDRIELLRLAETAEHTLGNSRISDWLSPAFFGTNFWFMWQTTFAFQPWHSAVEFRRYLHRFMNEYPRIETLAGVKRTIYNQCDSLVRPLVAWLASRGVQFRHGARVLDLEFGDGPGGGFLVGALVVNERHDERRIVVAPGDLVFLQNGSMTDASSVGSMDAPPQALTKENSNGWSLWERIASARPDFGNPAAFNTNIAESSWESFTVTCRTPAFFERMQAFTGNAAGTGGLVTLKDSRWLMSIVLYHQPHFLGQSAGEQVFWGYALNPDRIGDYVPHPMSDCSGREILRELCGHLRLDHDVFAGATCLPCRMPYITSMFMPRAPGDRPLPVPRSSINLAFVSQFVEIPQDVVFTVEYSVRAAQTAVYQLLNVDRRVPPITAHDRSVRVLVDSLEKSFA